MFRQFPAARTWLAGNTSVVNPRLFYKGGLHALSPLCWLELGVSPVLAPGPPAGLLLESTAVEVQGKEEGGCVGSGGETCSCPVLGYKVTQSRSRIIALLVRAERGGPCCVQ